MELSRGLAGFLLALTPLSCDLMGWRGAGGGGAASVYVVPQSCTGVPKADVIESAVAPSISLAASSPSW